MKNKILLLLTVLLIGVPTPPVESGMRIRFSFGDKGDRRHSGYYHYYHRGRHTRYHNPYYYDYYDYNYYNYKKVASSRVVDTRYTRNNRVIFLHNGMRFKIRGSGHDWTGHRARIYRKTIYQGHRYRDGEYWININGYQYLGKRIK